MAKGLRITAKRDGFRRAGIAHPGTPVDHLASKFTEAQIKALKNEPMLVVEEIQVKEEKAKEPDPPAT